MRIFLLLIVVALICCDNPNSKLASGQRNIIVSDFNDLNGKRERDLKGFFQYGAVLVKSDSINAYALVSRLDTLSKDSVLYVFIEEALKESTDWVIVAGLKIENLNSDQINNTCNNTSSISGSPDEKCFAILKNYDFNTDKADIFKAYKLDLIHKRFVETNSKLINCEIIRGED